MLTEIKEFWRMLGHGVAGISITEKRDYWVHVPASPAEEAQKRWLALGERFRNATDKVVAGSGRV